MIRFQMRFSVKRVVASRLKNVSVGQTFARLGERFLDADIAVRWRFDLKGCACPSGSGRRIESASTMLKILQTPEILLAGPVVRN